MKKRIIIILVIILAIAGIITAISFKQPSFIFDSFEKVKVTNNGKIVTYKGQTGTTALVLLQQNAKVVTSGTGKNAFVTSVNGVAADSSSQFWSFKINGSDATVGAGSYITKDSDTITWELVSF